MNKLAKFEKGQFYHVYNRAVGSEKLFYEDENYKYFLYRLYYYLQNHVEFYAYVLLRNHFHLLVRVPESHENPEIKISEQFRKLFIGYTQAINVRYNRMGSLFMKPFKRIQISDDAYLNTVFQYIHYNPAYHRVVKDFTTYKWSSFKILIGDKPTFLEREKIYGWYGSKEKFISTLKENLDKERISQGHLDDF